MRTVAGAVVSAKAVSLSKAAKILELFDVEAHKPGSYVRPDAAAYVRRASVAANQQALLHRELKHQRSSGAKAEAIEGPKADEAAGNKEKRRKGAKDIPSLVDGKHKKRNEIKEEKKVHDGEMSRKEVAELVADDMADEKKKKKKKRRREEGNQDIVGELARAEERKDMKEEKVHFDVALSRKDAELVLSNGMTDVKSNKKKRIKEEENKDFGGESVRAVMGVVKEKRKGTKEEDEEEEKKMDGDTSNKKKKNKKKKEGGDDIHAEEEMPPIMVLEDKESKKRRKKEEKKKRRKEEEEGWIEKAASVVPLDVSVNDKKEKKRKKREREQYGITGESDKEPMQLLDHSEQPKNKRRKKAEAEG